MGSCLIEHSLFVPSGSLIIVTAKNFLHLPVTTLQMHVYSNNVFSAMVHAILNLFKGKNKKKQDPSLFRSQPLSGTYVSCSLIKYTDAWGGNTCDLGCRHQHRSHHHHHPPCLKYTAEKQGQKICIFLKRRKTIDQFEYKTLMARGKHYSVMTPSILDSFRVVKSAFFLVTLCPQQQQFSCNLPQSSDLHFFDMSLFKFVNGRRKISLVSPVSLPPTFYLPSFLCLFALDCFTLTAVKI